MGEVGGWQNQEDIVQGPDISSTGCTILGKSDTDIWIKRYIWLRMVTRKNRVEHTHAVLGKVTSLTSEAGPYGPGQPFFSWHSPQVSYSLCFFSGFCYLGQADSMILICGDW
jgi:hypothetical protein